MSRFFLFLISILLIVPIGADADSLVTATNGGWTATINAEQHTLSIAHEALGAVLTDARLNLRAERGMIALSNWSVEKKGQNLLSLRTVNPPTVWLLELDRNMLKVSSTSTDAVLTAKAPAPPGRIVARLLDPQGVAVDWVGTHEVAEGYGGPETRNPSFLPSRNPEVMYFALGQATGSSFHSLFDRPTDTAINFPERTVMQRDPQDPDRLEVTIPVPGNSVVRLVPDYYTKTLGVPFYVPLDDSHFRAAPVVWCSWDSCYGDVREEDIVKNVDWIAAHLKAYGFDYIVLDDGYDRDPNGEHYWVGNWDPKKFPHGPQWLAGYIKSHGLHPGIWLVPNASAGAMEEHPEWYLRSKQDGTIIRDYNTPALDSTNPEVLDFLRKEFATLDDWGFEYYKFDGEYAIPKYVPAVDTNRLYDKLVDPLAAYRNRLKMIRATIGPGRFIEGCPAGTPLNGIGYFNSYFNGEDLYSSWQGNYAFFSSINANAFLNHIVVYTMAGEGIEVAPRMTIEEAAKKRPASFLAVAHTREDPSVGFGATFEEARTLATYASLTGVVYSLSSATPELPEERVKLLKMTLPSMPIFPIDLFSRGTGMPLWDLFKHTTPDDYVHNYPEILDLKVNAKSGVYDVVGFTNWRSWPATRELAFAEKLGLDPGSRYIAFDYWGQKLTGVFKDRMKMEIAPHDTRVFLIHPFLNRPQLVGTSRHITGAYSIQGLAWDSSKSRMRGISDAVPGDDYALWFYVPEGVTVAQVRATTRGKRAIPVRHEVIGNSLQVIFPGQQEAVSWEVEFAGRVSQ